MPAQTDVMEKIVALCRRRGFIFGSSEIYGGIGGFWDYGPLGTELKRNIKDAWWNDMVRNPPLGPNGIEFQMVGVDCSIIMNPKVWEASGHVSGFSDPLVECKKCRKRYRGDKVYFLEIPGPLTTIVVGSPLLAEQVEGDIALPACEGDDKKEAELFFRALMERMKRKRQLNPQVIQQYEGGQYRIVSALEAASRSRSCPQSDCGGELTPPRSFNLMLKTHVGALEDSSSIAYLRPETAQGIFANFKNVIDTTRVKVPFGIAQVGKSFRNEINPRNYTFRSREFEQYEIEFFCHESEAAMWYEFWRDVRYRWYVGLGLRSEKLRLREHEGSELAHYARSCADVEYDFPFGLSELEGIANRTDFDLNAHQKHSGKDLSYFDDQRQERFVPYVIEPSGGVDRSVLAFITEAYTYDESRASPEFMKFHPRLAPIKAAVFPLVAKDGMPEIAEPIYREIKKHYACQYDAKQSIGKRYARMDEAGTPFCFTIDGQSKVDGTVTVRDRDDASQIRIDKTQCVEYLHDKLRL